VVEHFPQNRIVLLKYCTLPTLQTNLADTKEIGRKKKSPSKNFKPLSTEIQEAQPYSAVIV